MAAGENDRSTMKESDPILSLLEQLAENENSTGGGLSELDYFLTTNAATNCSESRSGVTAGELSGDIVGGVEKGSPLLSATH